MPFDLATALLAGCCWSHVVTGRLRKFLRSVYFHVVPAKQHLILDPLICDGRAPERCEAHCESITSISPITKSPCEAP